MARDFFIHFIRKLGDRNSRIGFKFRCPKKERVEKNGGGWIIDVSDIKNIESKILEIRAKPEEYIAKTNEIHDINLKDIDSMILEYDSVYINCLKFTNPLHFSNNAFTNNDLFKHIFTRNLYAPNETSHRKVGYRANLLGRLIQCYKDNGFNYTVNRTKMYTVKTFFANNMNYHPISGMSTLN